MLSELSEKISITAEKANSDALVNASELAKFKECFSVQLDELQSALKAQEETVEKNLASMTHAVNSKVNGMELTIKELESIFTERHKRLLWISGSALVFSIFFIGFSIYSLVVLK